MKSEATLDFINKTQSLVTPVEFEQIKFKLFKIQKQFRKPFLSILFSGYSVNCAFKNFRNLYDFSENNLLDYGLAIRLITNIAAYSEEGLFINDLTRYELN